MAKPSLMQNLLNRPSQTYSHPPKKDYHSSRELMVRIAAETFTTTSDDRSTHMSDARESSVWAEYEREKRGSSRRINPPSMITSPYYQQLQQQRENREDEDDSSSGDEMYFTPPTSPRASRALSTVSKASSSKISPAPPLPTSMPEHVRKGSSTSSASLSSTLVTTATEEVVPQRKSADASSPTRRLRRVPKHVKYTTNQDWAKDVRWLVPPSASPSSGTTVSESKRAYSSRVPPPTSSMLTINTPSSNTSSSNAPLHIHTPQPRTKLAPPSAMSAVAEEPDERSLSGSLEGVPNGFGNSPDSHSQSSSRTHTLRRAKPSPKRTLSRASSTSTATPIQSLPMSSTAPDIPSKGTPGYTSLTLARAPLLNNHKETGKGVASGYIDLTLTGEAQTTMATVEVVRGMSGSTPSTTSGLGRLKSLRRGVSMKKQPQSEKGDEGGIALTIYRSPPSYVSGGSVLVQVWAVGIDLLDWRITRAKLGLYSASSIAASPDKEKTGLGRSNSVKSLLGLGLMRKPSIKSNASVENVTNTEQPEAKEKGEKEKKADVGFIPGRAFVGRVMEYGWRVKENDGVKRGEWVVGLTEARKCGALAQFIVVDRRRIHVVGHPYIQPAPPDTPALPTSSSSRVRPPLVSADTLHNVNQPPTLSELTLVPLCGVPAWRAVRTFNGIRGLRNRRILVLGGECGMGGLVGRILAERGWRVMFWVSSARENTTAGLDVAQRLIEWGCEEVLFRHARKPRNEDDECDDERHDAIKIVEELIGDGEMFDGVLDCVGGRDVWEAGERLLSRCEDEEGDDVAARRARQFTTFVGDNLAKPLPTASDHYKAGMRTRTGGSRQISSGSVSLVSLAKIKKGKGKAGAQAKAKVSYAWVHATTDIDLEGEDVRGSIAAVLEERERCARTTGTALFGQGMGRVDSVPLEKCPDIFGRKGEEKLSGGAAIVVKVV